MRKLILSLALTISLIGGGCAAWRASSTTHKVTIAQHNFLQVVGGFQDAEIAEFEQGRITSDTHVKIQSSIRSLALAGRDLDESVISGAGAATVKAKIATILGLLSQLESDRLLGVKNPTSKAMLELALNQMKSFLTLTLTQVS